MGMQRDHLLQQLGERLVQAEVYYCVSALVGELIKRAFGPDPIMGEDDALTLSRRAPHADDYKDAAPDHVGIVKVGESAWRIIADEEGDTREYSSVVEAWRAAFDLAGEDLPDGPEVYEHWIVSDWLAARLIEEGESVARDVMGLTIWGRTCTGQSMVLDSVIQKIALDTYGEPAMEA